MSLHKRIWQNHVHWQMNLVFFRRSHVVFLDNISRYLIVQDISQQMELVNIYHSKTFKGTPIKFFKITINSVHFKCLQIVRGIYGEVTWLFPQTLDSCWEDEQNKQMLRCTHSHHFWGWSESYNFLSLLIRITLFYFWSSNNVFEFHYILLSQFPSQRLKVSFTIVPSAHHSM